MKFDGDGAGGVCVFCNIAASDECLVASVPAAAIAEPLRNPRRVIMTLGPCKSGKML